MIYSELLDVPLTTIHQDIKGIAKVIGENIINVLEKGNEEVIFQVIPSSLVERDSVAKGRRLK